MGKRTALAASILTAMPPVGPSTNDAGVNMAWLEFGSPRATWNYDVEPASMAYFAGVGLRLIRIPFLWERIQPTLMGPLDTVHLGVLTRAVAAAHAVGCRVILDMHNYGGYTPAEGAGSKIGGGVITVAHFADAWSRLAAVFVDIPGVVGYDIMNEPAGMPSLDVWPVAAQAAINAIRQHDMSRSIYVEGNNYSGAYQWVTSNPGLHLITDPANKIIFSAHCYLDRDNSGSHYDWDVELANGSYYGIGQARISVFVGWLQQHGFRGHIGELGTGTSAGWQQELESTVSYIKASGLQLTGWAAGHMWGSYPYSLHPDTSQFRMRSQPQIAVYRKVFGLPGGEVFDSGSTYSTPGTTVTITVYMRGYIPGPLRINISASAGAVLSATYVDLPAGLNPSATYTLSLASGSAFMTYSRDDGGQVPPVRGYTVEDYLFNTTDALTQQNILALRRVIDTYSGPCVRLRRTSDNAEQDFGFTGLARNDGVDVQAITSWAAGAQLRVVTWFDQSGMQRNAVPVFSDNSVGPAAPSDQPLFIPSAFNGLPTIRFDGTHRMDAESPINGKTQITTVMVHKPIEAQRLLSWHFTDFYLLGDVFEASNEPNRNVSMGIDSSAWHVYATTHTGSFDGSGKRRTWRDGVQIGEQPNYVTAISFAHRSNVNIGWFRWYGASRYRGDVSELYVIARDIGASGISQLTQSARAYLGI